MQHATQKKKLTAGIQTRFIYSSPVGSIVTKIIIATDNNEKTVRKLQI